ncbi:hypothetical protein [Corynebacterium variabile]|uniref:hypothetical protein n=1 Tax=Corynebacterium variabile TaxID=1727 RepID=UPI0028ACE087|nr:hypothetical protein [Corynebacterium variabile]
MPSKLQWNPKAFEVIRRSPGVMDAVDVEADSIAAECGSGYTTSSVQGKTRYRTIVIPDSYKAYRDNQKNNTLVKVLSARKLS